MGKRKKSAAPPVSRPRSHSGIGRWYRHNKARVQRFLVIGILAVAALILIVVGLRYVLGRGERMSKADLISLGREKLLLGYFDDAILNYHKASNLDPNDPLLQREYRLARQRSTVSNRGSLDQTFLTAHEVLQLDSRSLVATVCLAQYFEMRNLPDSLRHYAHRARDLALQSGDRAGQVASGLLLATYFRTFDRQDSVLVYDREALAAATTIGDTLQIAFASASLGFAAVRLDSLEAARELFTMLVDYRGQNREAYVEIGRTGLADYFHRSRQYDSALVYLRALQTKIERGAVDGTTAYATSVFGRVMRDRGDHEMAITLLLGAQQNWESLRSTPDIIDNLNDLAKAYRAKNDFFNARKYYLAAGKLAGTAKLPHKDQYTADLNLLFLKNLKSDEYVRAGAEGEELATRLQGS